ncbi:MAG: flagellar protein FlaG [Sphingomonadales bacterium]
MGFPGASISSESRRDALPPRESSETERSDSVVIPPNEVEKTAVASEIVVPAEPADRVDSAVPEDPIARVSEVIDEFLDEIKGPETRLNIDRDEETGQFVYQSIDRETGEVQRQFPPEEILKRIATFREIQGLIYDDEV